MNGTWIKNLSSTFKYALFSVFWIATFYFLNNAITDPMSRSFAVLIPGLFCMFCTLKSAWFAVITILWPVLVAFGVITPTPESTE